MIQSCINDELWIVSDGGTHNGLGYFGWVIATSTSVLWEDYGQVPGNAEQMDSLRAESYGTLAATEFLLQLYQSGKINTKANIHHFCDNKIVVQRLQLYSSNKTWFPNELVKAHMDVQLQIELTLNQQSTTWSTNHVYGHQDKKSIQEYGKPS